MYRAKTRGAFTLVELLVVIGIATLLVGILMPVLGRAWEHARTIQCADQIKQICHAVLMYASENKGALPMVGGLPVSVDSENAKLPVHLEEFGRLDFREGALWTYLDPSPAVREQVFLCPSDEPPRFAKQYLLPKADPKYSRNFSYVLHAWLCGYARRIPPNGFQDWAPLRITRVRRASHKVLLFEEEMPKFAAGTPVAPPRFKRLRRSGGSRHRRDAYAPSHEKGKRRLF